ncbi:hypothetical protein E3U43_019677 [Larimichthys crocea]|uniref:Uncharacterized protein n=1 Tax=Larimichthys crocea TaxID=215358 RepID=A0ACD3QW41_LARCR|nr:hypothetical protein E3U43_019677 [Larimichthys crocea]
MNVLKNTILHPHLRDEEAAVVENAIRLAIDSVINVLCGVNSAKTHEHRRMVADRDKEIQRLECRLKEIEHELQVLRRHGCTCGSQPATCDPHSGEQSGFEPGGEMSAAQQQQECEMSISCKNKKKTVPMSELPEETQRLKRAAWRAASKRYYARKIARQQASSSRPGPFPHITDSRFTQPITLVDKRRRTTTRMISELTDESQTLQREAWRAASRRYYARKKIAHHRDESMQYMHLLQNIEPSDETLGPNRGGSHTNSGGIMCS